MRAAGRAVAGAFFALLALVPGRSSGADAAARVPELFDPDHRITQPDVGAVTSIRFLTTDDFPPFHFTLQDGTLGGFDIDLARAVCRDLKLACTIQARRFDTLIREIKAGKDDALIAAVANTPKTRADLTFTDPYYTTPARFVVKAKSSFDAGTVATISPGMLIGHRIGVEAGTAHEAYLKTFFPKSKVTSYRNQFDLRAALKMDEVELIFADGIRLAVWLNEAEGQACCTFRGGPFSESRFFGNGVAIAVSKDNVVLRQLLDFELAKLSRDGIYADLYLKYFPIGFY